MTRLLACAAAAALLSACMSDDGMATTSGARMMMANDNPAVRAADDAPAYAMTAAASDMFEIQSSQLALQHSQNADVRAFAQMMIDHHTLTTQKLMTALQQANMPPPPQALPPAKATRLQALSAAHGAEFDRMYMREQVLAHEEALAVHQGFSMHGNSAPLKALASQAVPIIQQHLARARDLSAGLG